MTDHNLNAFADSMVELGRANGFVLGMKRAIEIMRKHDIRADHPARTQVFDEMMDSTREGVTAYANGAFNASPPPPATA